MEKEITSSELLGSWQFCRYLSIRNEKDIYSGQKYFYLRYVCDRIGEIKNLRRRFNFSGVVLKVSGLEKIENTIKGLFRGRFRYGDNFFRTVENRNKQIKGFIALRKRITIYLVFNTPFAYFFVVTNPIVFCLATFRQK